jgi:hypothetical protein
MAGYILWLAAGIIPWKIGRWIVGQDLKTGSKLFSDMRRSPVLQTQYFK